MAANPETSSEIHPLEAHRPRFVAIDVGSGFVQWTAATADGQETSGAFPSIVTSAPEDEREAAVVVDGEAFLIGEHAADVAQEEDFLETRSPDFPGSPAWRALLYAALVEANVAREQRVGVYTGLPQARYRDQADGLKEKLIGTHRFSFEGDDYQLTVPECDQPIIPQAGAAYFVLADADPSLAEGRVGIIDVGTYTTGLSVFRQGRPIRKEASGVDIGVSKLADAVSGWIKEVYNRTLNYEEVPEVIRTGTINYRGRPQDVSDGIQRHTREVAEPILNEIQRVWRNAGDDKRVVVVGGGAAIFIEAIRELCPHAELAEEPRWAVPRGLFAYARQYEDGE